MNIIITLCMLAISYAANAQYDPAFRFGIKAGTNLSNIKGSNDLSLAPGGNAFNFKDNDNRSLGFAGGVFFRFGKTFYMQPEILLSQKGGKFNVYKDGMLNDMEKWTCVFPTWMLLSFLGCSSLNFFAKMLVRWHRSDYPTMVKSVIQLMR